MTGYTKGEWSVSENEIVCYDEPNGEPWYIAIVCECVGENGSDTPRNARLISAAPEMYEALKLVWEAVYDYCGPDSEELARVDAALAKAEGKA